MCGRFAMDPITDAEIREFVQVTGLRPDTWTPSWNIKPTQPIPLLLEVAPGEGQEPGRRFELASWSLIPSGSPTKRLRFPTFNARAEGLAGKATWRGPVKAQRSIVLARGWYEWQLVDGVKRPQWIHHPDGQLLGMAGLHSWWPDPARSADDPARWELTATIITTAAPPALAAVHDRAPLVLAPEWWSTWIDAGTTGDQSLVDAAAAASIAGDMTHWEVAPVRGDGPQLIEPVEVGGRG